MPDGSSITELYPTPCLARLTLKLSCLSYNYSPHHKGDFMVSLPHTKSRLAWPACVMPSDPHDKALQGTRELPDHTGCVCVPSALTMVTVCVPDVASSS